MPRNLNYFWQVLMQTWISTGWLSYVSCEHGSLIVSKAKLLNMACFLCSNIGIVISKFWHCAPFPLWLSYLLQLWQLCRPPSTKSASNNKLILKGRKIFSEGNFVFSHMTARFYTLFFYKHHLYKHRQPEIWPKNKHHPSTSPSLTSISTNDCLTHWFVSFLVTSSISRNEWF